MLPACVAGWKLAKGSTSEQALCPSIKNVTPQVGAGPCSALPWTRGACCSSLSGFLVGAGGAAGGGGECPPEAAAGEGDHRGQAEEAGGRPDHHGGPELQAGQGEALGVLTGGPESQRAGVGWAPGPRPRLTPPLPAALWLLLSCRFLLGVPWPLVSSLQSHLQGSSGKRVGPKGKVCYFSLGKCSTAF